MATETLVPTAIESSAELVSPVVSDVDTDDTTWTTWDDEGDTNILVSFATPSGDPTTGSGLQTMRTRMRRNASGGASGMTSEQWVYESGSDTIGSTISTNSNASADPGTEESGSWDAVDLGTADGSAAEIFYVQTARGTGNPTQIRGCEHDYMFWDVDYTAGAAGSSYPHRRSTARYHALGR